jgi:hypothetical protein
MNEENSASCFICDKSFIINNDGTTNHLNEDGDVDHDEDANHVPYLIGDDHEQAL